MTEREMLDLLVQHINDLRKRKEVGPVGNPDYQETNFYVPQWRCTQGLQPPNDGLVYFYQLPRQGKVLALRSEKTGDCFFSAAGLPIKWR